MKQVKVTCDFCSEVSDKTKEAELKIGDLRWPFDLCAKCFKDGGVPFFKKVWATICEAGNTHA